MDKGGKRGAPALHRGASGQVMVSSFCLCVCPILNSREQSGPNFTYRCVSVCK